MQDRQIVESDMFIVKRLPMLFELTFALSVRLCPVDAWPSVTDIRCVSIKLNHGILWR